MPSSPADRPLQADEDHRRTMLGHRRIDSFPVIEATLDPDLINASDFCRSSIEARIRAGLRRCQAPRRGLARGQPLATSPRASSACERPEPVRRSPEWASSFLGGPLPGSGRVRDRTTQVAGWSAKAGKR